MKFPGWITLQLATLTAVALLAFALVTQTNRIRTLQAEKEAAAAALVKGDEAHRLEVAGLKLAHEASQEALERDLEEERQAKGILANALAKAGPAAVKKAGPLGDEKGSEYKLASAVEITSKEAYSAIARNASGGPQSTTGAVKATHVTLKGILANGESVLANGRALLAKTQPLLAK